MKMKDSYLLFVGASSTSSPIDPPPKREFAVTNLWETPCQLKHERDVGEAGIVFISPAVVEKSELRDLNKCLQTHGLQSFSVFS